MDVELLIVIVAAGSCAISILSELINRLRVPLWDATILLGLALGTFLKLETFTLSVGILWIVVFFMVLTGPVLIEVAVYRFRAFSLASWYSRLLHSLFPMSPIKELSEYHIATQELANGDAASGNTRLEKIARLGGKFSRSAFIDLTRIRGTWSAFSAWYERHRLELERGDDPLLVEARLQSLGELGERTQLLTELQKEFSHNHTEFPPQALTLVLLRSAAHVGDLESVRLIQPVLPESMNDIREYWELTALQVQGVDVAERFSDLSDRASPLIKLPIQGRIERPLPSLLEQPLSEDELLIWRGFREKIPRLVKSIRKAGYEGTFEPASVATNGILLVLTVVFLIETIHGSTDFDWLVQMGALVIPASPGNDQWWRPITASAIHFGVMHLLMNQFGIFIAGVRLERVWGSLRLLTTYLATAVGAMWLSPFFTSLDGIEPGDEIVMMGASGGVMGLFGAFFTQLLISYFRDRSPYQKMILIQLGIALVLQTVIDSNVEGISGEAHILGFLIGVLFCLVWNYFPGLKFEHAMNQPR